MNALLPVLAIMRSRASRAASGLVRNLALLAIVGALAAGALGLFSAAAIIALAEHVGIVESLAIVGLAYVAVAAIVYALARRARQVKTPPPPVPMDIGSPPVTANLPSLTNSLFALGAIAAAGYIMAQRLKVPPDRL